MNQILKDYNISFSKKYSLSDDVKKVALGNTVLSGFLSSFQDSDSIQNAMQQIEYYINGGIYDSDKEFFSTDIYEAFIDNSEVAIFSSMGSIENEISLKIPIIDMKSILQEWLNFISPHWTNYRKG